MKIVCCAGGLGNQMFQYALYNYLKGRGFRVSFDVSSRQLDRHTGFELQRVFPKIRLQARTDQSRLVRRIKHAVWSLGWNYPLPFVGKDNDEDIRTRSFRETIFCGYWQQPGFVNEMRDQLLADFQFIPMDKKNEEAAQHIAQTPSVSIHIRRGDYTNPENESLGRICTLEYYRSAIEWISAQIQDPNFIVFSDDMDWVKHNLVLENALYVDWNRGQDSFRDMQLMSLCKHNIIANSTFSWWGAWLNRNSEKKVVGPGRWQDWTKRNWLSEGDLHCIEV